MAFGPALSGQTTSGAARPRLTSPIAFPRGRAPGPSAAPPAIGGSAAPAPPPPPTQPAPGAPWMSAQAPGGARPVPTSPPGAPWMSAQAPGYGIATPGVRPATSPSTNTVHLPTGINGYQPPSAPPVPAQTVQTLPAGTPTAPGNVAATAPLPYQSFGDPASVNPAMASPFDQQGYYQQYAQMLGQSTQPYFQQQQDQLNQDLRARGIQDSGAAGYLEGNLLSQQGATLAGQDAPFLSQAFGYANQDVLGNQQAANEAAYYNAGQYTNAVNQNYDAYNNYLQQLLGLGGSNYGALQSAYLNSFGPSTGVESGYNSAIGNVGNIYGNVYGQALNAQNQNLSNSAMMLAAGG